MTGRTTRQRAVETVEWVVVACFLAVTVILGYRQLSEKVRAHNESIGDCIGGEGACGPAGGAGTGAGGGLGAGGATGTSTQASTADEPGWFDKGTVSGGVLSFGKGVVVDGLGGALVGIKDLAVGVVTDPIGTGGAVLSGIGNAVLHPIDTVTGIKDGFVAAYEKDGARAVGKALFDVASTVIPVSKAGVVGKIARGSDAVVPDAAADVATARQAVTDAEKLASIECKGGVCTAPGQCFVAGTPVAMAIGAKPIEEVATGDLVLTRDPESGETRHERVAQTFARQAAVVALVLAGAGGVSEQLTTTAEHPFRVHGAGFHKVADLLPGDEVDTSTGTARIVALASLPETRTVYNFEVERTHTYFVGRTAAWVHNACAKVADEVAPHGGRPEVTPRMKDDPPRTYAVEQDGRRYSIIDETKTDAYGHRYQQLRVEGAPPGQGILTYNVIADGGTVHMVDLEKVNGIKTGEGPPGAGKALKTALLDNVVGNRPLNSRALIESNDKAMSGLVRDNPVPSIEDLKKTVPAFRHEGYDYKLDFDYGDARLMMQRNATGESRLTNPEIFKSEAYRDYLRERGIPEGKLDAMIAAQHPNLSAPRAVDAP